MTTDARKITELKLKFQQYGWKIEPEYDESNGVVAVYGTHGKKTTKLFTYRKGNNYGQN